MDVLKDKSTKSYDYVSRYAGFYTYYNTLDNKYMYGLTSQLLNSTNFVLINNIKPTDTLDSLSNKYYGRPDFYWVIADYNRIIDPFITLYGNFETLKIPTLTEIEYMEY